MIVVFFNSNPRKWRKQNCVSMQSHDWNNLEKKLKVNCGDSHFSSHTAQRWSLFTQHSCLESQPDIQTQLSTSNRFKPLNICLSVHRDDSWSGLACLPGSCSSTRLTGLIAIYPDKLPFGFHLRHSTSVGEGRECVPRINVRVWHEISVESRNTEGKAWTSLSLKAQTQKSSMQDSFVLWLTF